MSLINEIRTKLNFLSEKLAKSPDELSVDERLQHLEALREVVHTARAMEKSLQKNAECDSGDETTLRMVGMFPYNADRSFMLPSKEGVQHGLAWMSSTSPRLSVEVTSVFSEKNFNFLKYPTISHNYLLEEEEVYVRFKTPEQASYVLGLSGGSRVVFDFSGRTEGRIFQFSIPVEKQSIRVTYRSIGTLLKRIRVIDSRLKDLGAVPGRGGVPVLREDFVDAKEFDETVDALLENMQEVEQGLSTRRIVGHTGKEELHGYLVSKIKVNKKKRQGELDGLVQERIEILLKLCSFNLDEPPFSFDREFR
jgi:hypothetical protein